MRSSRAAHRPGGREPEPGLTAPAPAPTAPRWKWRARSSLTPIPQSRQVRRGAAEEHIDAHIEECGHHRAGADGKGVRGAERTRRLRQQQYTQQAPEREITPYHPHSDRPPLARTAASAVEIAAATGEVDGNGYSVAEQQRRPCSGSAVARAGGEERCGDGKLEHRHQERCARERWRHHLVGAEGGGEARRVEQLVKRSAREQQHKSAGEQRSNGGVDHEADIIPPRPIPCVARNAATCAARGHGGEGHGPIAAGIVDHTERRGVVPGRDDIEVVSRPVELLSSSSRSAMNRSLLVMTCPPAGARQ